MSQTPLAVVVMGGLVTSTALSRGLEPARLEELQHLEPRQAQEACGRCDSEVVGARRPEPEELVEEWHPEGEEQGERRTHVGLTARRSPRTAHLTRLDDAR